MTKLVVYETDLQGEIETAENELAELTDHHAHLLELIERADLEFLQYDVELSTEVSQLQAKLEDLQQAEAPVDDTVLGSTVNTEVGIAEPRVVVDTDSGIELSHKCKKIYKQICSKCHPDKCQSDKLVYIIMLAKKASKAMNYEKLLELLSSVLTYDTVEVEGMTDSDMLIFLKSEVIGMTNLIREILLDDGYILYEIYDNEGIEAAAPIRARALRISKIELIKELYEYGV